MRKLTAELANLLATIALGHVGREYPNKLDHVLDGPGDALGPRALHPIFYGSFDWHSSVHSHWLLARLVRRFPDTRTADAALAWLDQAFTDANVAGELAYLARPSARGFERPGKPLRPLFYNKRRDARLSLLAVRQGHDNVRGAH